MKKSTSRAILKVALGATKTKKDLIPGLPPDTPIIFHQPKRPKKS